MENLNNFEVIIVGGSYAGLSAGMTLGRSLRKTLIIDSAKPCNRYTNYAHNFITQDGEKPGDIAAKAKAQVEQYDTVQFKSGLVTAVNQVPNGFEVTTADGAQFHAQIILFATGVRDLLPEIEGLEETWGKSVLHCPYCHGYEVRGVKTGVIARGNTAYGMGKMIHHWTKDLTVFTNGESDLEPEQQAFLEGLGISINEKVITKLVHENGQIEKLVFSDGSQESLEAAYFPMDTEQHCPIPEQLGCKMTEQGHIEVDEMQKTSVPGVYAAGDNTSPFRTLSNASAAGTIAGAAINNELIEAALAPAEA